MKDHLKNPIFTIVSEVASEWKTPVYLVGGYVRDLILDRPSQDIDIMVVGNGIGLAERVSARLRLKKIQIFENFGTAMLRYRDLEIEFVGARRESYRKSSRHPIVEDGTLEDDLRRRDFTINTLAISLDKGTYGELVDPFNGMMDIRNHIIRTPLDPDQTFSDDPLRMLRAVRFASQLHFAIEPVTFESIIRNRQRVEILSYERITYELNKIILSKKPSIGFKLLDKTGLLELVLPELYAMKGIEEKNGQRHKDNFQHTIKVLDNISPNTDNLWLRWATLLHDIAKPVTKKYDDEFGWTFHGHNHFGAKMASSIFRRLKLPLNEKLKYVEKLVNLHMRPVVLAQETVTDSAVRRLLFEAGDDIDDLMTLCEADITSGIPSKVIRYMQNFQIVREKIKEIEEKDRIRNWQPPVSGDEIMTTFGLPPSKPVGVIKTAIKEAILDGIIHNDREEAWAFMIKRAREIGLQPVEGYENPIKKIFMEKVDFKPGTMIYPLPAVLVSCGDDPSNYNLITIAWTGTLCTDPPMCYISMRPQRHSYQIIKRTGEFVINLTPAHLAKVVDWCGVKSGRDVNKFEAMKLTPGTSSVVRAPLIMESPVNIECRVTEMKELGVHHMFMAEVVNIRVSENLVDPVTGNFNLTDANLIAYVHGNYRYIGKKIGKFGYSVQKRSKNAVRKGPPVR